LKQKVFVNIKYIRITNNKLNKTMSNEFTTMHSVNNTTDIIIDNSRTICDRYDSISTTGCSKRDDLDLDQNNNKETAISVNIFRFKFTDDFTNELYKFSKIHQYDHRKDFKEAWEIWIEENTDLVNEETRRLIEIGYEGDILDKMFKSARYYFRKKSSEKKLPKERRVYVGVQKGLLDSMDEHILNNINNDEYKPSSGFLSFCQEYTDVLKEEVANLCKSGISDNIEIKNKIKKTYKNRYFMIISK